jgi:hypothetical protein
MLINQFTASLISFVSHPINIFGFSTTLLVDELMHGIIGIPLAMLLYKKTGSKMQLVYYYLALYLIDTDHLIDYILFAKINFSLTDFFQLEFFNAKDTAYLIFHGWEWVFLLGILAYKKGWKHWITAITLGIFSHLIWDIHNFKDAKFYSIIYRATNDFKISTMVGQVKGWKSIWLYKTSL